MKSEQALKITEIWVDAANRQDHKQIAEVSDPGIEIIGPRGTGYGHKLLFEWLERANLTLKTVRSFSKENQVVLAQHGTWHEAETAKVKGEANIASRFRIENGLVTQFQRYDHVEDALKDAGLTYEDEK